MQFHAQISCRVCILVFLQLISHLACEAQEDVSSGANVKPPPEVDKPVATGSSKTVELRQIDVPTRENGYKHFDTCLINSAAEMQTFLESVAEQPHWNKKPEFIEAINRFDLDFSTESLLLVRDTEGSGAIKVWLQTPKVLNRALVIRVRRNRPRISTLDMAYYCFALVVPRGIADSVKIFGSNTSARSIVDNDGNRKHRQGHSKDIELALEAR